MAAFRDYVPAGEDVGAGSGAVFRDFVPEPPLVKREVPEEVKEEVKKVVKPLKKKKK
jgi:hypothetical protein